jgi:hypothetical protein
MKSIFYAFQIIKLSRLNRRVEVRTKETKNASGKISRSLVVLKSQIHSGAPPQLVSCWSGSLVSRYDHGELMPEERFVFQALMSSALPMNLKE